MSKRYWEVVKAAANKAELLIYGEISSMAFWGDEVTPKDVNDMLNAIGDNISELTVRINSPGGDVFAGVAIHSMLKRHPANVTVYVDGLAASIASIIALAGNKIVMPKGSLMMIHRPMGSARMSRSEGLRQRADLLDKIENEMTDLYSTKSGISAEDIKVLLEKETWYTAEEAVAAGLADEVEGDLEVAACLQGDTAIINGVEVNWKQFANAPILPKVESPAAVDYSFKNAARNRELQLKFREV
ncbi:head maturation protease, ClpP-related [Cohnella luojiensis]|uniref:ATP-dependent Clp protease proteolytic subunit n=1 Tax=Cohnella luojiensis TaxID=652876 RepID=A0A4Y8M6V2_9BACL|nr:head maturation protease, ClpP-related [Cohnella luojiensis]TFE30828.1 Clp protease ClpP [Cohnella luojiensis]